MSDAPERIFAGQTFNGERDWTANGDASGGYAAYTRTDLSEAAIAAARAEGVREGMLKAAEIAEDLIIYDLPAERATWARGTIDAAEAIRAAAGFGLRHYTPQSKAQIIAAAEAAVKAIRETAQ